MRISDHLEEIARIIELLAACAAVVYVLVIGAGVLSKIADDKWGNSPIWAAVLFSLAITIYFFAQLLHIRACLEEIRKK